MPKFSLLTIVITIIYLCLSFVFTKNALHMFQQQRYELRRYTKWLFNKRNIHFSFILIYVLLVLVIRIVVKTNIAYILYLLITILFAIYYIYKENNKSYIKELVITSRVKRQIVVMFVLLAYCFYNLIQDGSFALLSISSIYLPYLLIYVMAIITYPLEDLIKRHYEDDARIILSKYDSLIKVGITGSFGKTSTKNIINDIISKKYFTLITPASYNTPMGITRTVREYLKPVHEVFVCEMGADKVGDISYLMKFVRPTYGIVTSIGPQHLNTFNTMNNIIKEKMQEIEMLPNNGVGIINIDNEYIEKYQITNRCKIVTVGINNELADYRATNIKYSKDGTSFKVKINKKNYSFKTSLLGQHNITNILSGIALAIELNIDIKEIVDNVKNINQVEHRLQLKKINNYTFIDDAFNSNPVGSKMALDVLEMMPGKRIIVTPGMIDLGKKQNEYNYEFGKYMLNKTDYVLLVGEIQTKKIYQGLKDVNFDMEKVIVFKTVKEALMYVYSNFTSSDTILLENDLPDAFNV